MNENSDPLLGSTYANAAAAIDVVPIAAVPSFVEPIVAAALGGYSNGVVHNGLYFPGNNNAAHDYAAAAIGEHPYNAAAAIGEHPYNAVHSGSSSSENNNNPAQNNHHENSLIVHIDSFPDTEAHEIAEPVVNMSFDTIAEAFEYYKKYGKQSGFPVKKRTSTNGDDGDVKYYTFSCGRADKFKSKSSKSLQPRPSLKIDCKALIRLGKSCDGRWKINTAKLEHNHGLSPSKSRYFPVNRDLSASMKRRLEMNDAAKIGLNKSYSSLVVEAHGHDKISFLEKDARNHIEKTYSLG